MPTWVKATERLPKNDGRFFVLMQYFNKDKRNLVKNAVSFDGIRWAVYAENEVIEWLDESTPDYWKQRYEAAEQYLLMNDKTHSHEEITKAFRHWAKISKQSPNT